MVVTSSRRVTTRPQQWRSNLVHQDVLKTHAGHMVYSRISLDSDYSPLVRLYTLASSSDMATNHDFHVCRVNQDGMSQNRRVLRATKSLLEQDPSILLKCSSLTGCSPLHAALRNFGDCLPLIHVLTSRPESRTLLEHRNRFGDLPLHVACSVGVPLVVLKLVVECTLSASRPSPKLGSAFSTHPLLWSMNHAGCTPIDLVWVRHIEGGQGMYSPKSSYSLDSSGVRKYCFKQDDYYQNLLRDAVNTILGHQNNGSLPISTKSQLDRQREVEMMFGSLLERICLLVTASAWGIPSISSPTLLHNIFKLSVHDAPHFPRPLVDLFLWYHRGQVLVKDSHGMLPLHYAMHRQTIHTPSVGNNALSDSTAWKELILKLLEVEPESSKVSNQDGRLPLHMILDFVTERTDDTACMHDVIRELVDSFPESLDQPDPITGLDPFLLAATNPSLDLNVIFTLLRLSPARCTPRGSHNN